MKKSIVAQSATTSSAKEKKTSGQRGEPPQATELHPSKVVLSIKWDWRGVVLYELLPENRTISFDTCYSQLDNWKLNIVIREKPNAE